MVYQATTYSVMIASPSDVAVERNAIRQILEEWNAVHSHTRKIVLLPVGWETHSSPEMGDHPQTILNRQILERSDLLIGVFWTRVGTPTTEYASGSVEEIEEHVSSGKPAMLYFSNEPVRPDSVDSEQYEELLKFKKSCSQRGLLEEYEDAADFRNKLSRQLQIKLNNDPYFQSESAPETQTTVVPPLTHTPEVSLSDEAKLLLATAAATDGSVTRLSYYGGTSVGAGSQSFAVGNDQRAVAQWESAVDQLEREGLIEDKAGKRVSYFVTHKGFETADTLPKPS